MINKNDAICKMYKDFSIEEIIGLTGYSRDEIYAILYANGVIKDDKMKDAEYEMAKELYVGGETLKSISSILQFLSKSELRDRLLKDGVLRHYGSKTYVDKNEYKHLEDLAYMYVRAKGGNSLLSICREVGLPYHRVAYLCEKIKGEFENN